MRFNAPLRPRRVGLALGALAAYLAVQNLITEYLVTEVLNQEAYPVAAELLDLFSVNTEESLPTWYASLLLLIAAVLLFLISRAKRRSGERAALWTGLAGIFLYLSLDEGIVIHEIAASWAREAFNPTGFLTFGWQLVFGPLLVLFALVYFRFWLRLPPRTRLGFAAAGILYVGGAFFIEGISAALWESASGVSYPYLVVATVEEFCEMLGAVVLIAVLLDYMAEEGHTLVLTPYAPPGPVAQLDLRRWALIGGVIVLLNVALIVGVFSLPGEGGMAGDGFVYPSLIDQLTVDGVVVARTAGRFGFNAPPDPLVVTLAEQFPALTVISLSATDTTLVLAGETIPHSSTALIDILHSNGETQFVILDDAAVRLILRRASE